MTMKPRANCLMVKVMNATDLVARDLISGSSDPYAVVGLLESDNTMDKLHIYKTTVIKNSLNPEWQYARVFEIPYGYHDNRPLLVELWDKDFLFDDFLGQAIVDTSHLPVDGELVDSYFALQSRPKKHDKSITGKVHLQIMLLRDAKPVPPYDPSFQCQECRVHGYCEHIRY